MISWLNQLTTLTQWTKLTNSRNLINWTNLSKWTTFTAIHPFSYLFLNASICQQNDIRHIKKRLKTHSFDTFDFHMCWVPQQRALFEIEQPSNRQKAVRTPSSILRCSLPNVLRTTEACTFFTSQLQKCPSMVRFVTFHFQTCWAPQRHTLFRHRTGHRIVKTMSEPLVCF